MDKAEETDPSGRFVRLSELLGSGAFKSVYKAIDRDRGIEVAWNQLRLDRFQDQDFIKLYGEIQILGQLKHQHIIEFYGSWINEQKHEVVFITECMTSGTLKQFIRRARNLKLSVIHSWCIQILKGLNYLHTRSPPIIHRDIKCDNIFINGSLGEVKIGDLGLATVKKSHNALSVIGTPEFMAPEYYEEKYTEKVDIWAFGLCVLEMVTHDYPYSECSNPAQIFKRVSTGNLPAGLERITDEDVRAFIRLCLAPEHQRPSAADLLKHPFLSGSALDDERQVPIVDNLPRLEANGQPPSAPTSMCNPLAQEQQYTITFGEEEAGPAVTETQIIAVDTNQYADKIILKLMLCVSDERREIEFPFDLKIDKATEVATEMVHALQLPKSSLITIATLIQNHVDEATRQREEKKRLQEQLANAGIPVSISQDGGTTPIGTGSGDLHRPITLPTQNESLLAASSISLNAPVSLAMGSSSISNIPIMAAPSPVSVVPVIQGSATPIVLPGVSSATPSPVVVLPQVILPQVAQLPQQVPSLMANGFPSTLSLAPMSASLPTLPSVSNIPVITVPATVPFAPPTLTPSISSPAIPSTMASIVAPGSTPLPSSSLATSISSNALAYAPVASQSTPHKKQISSRPASPMDSPTMKRKMTEFDATWSGPNVLSELLDHHHHQDVERSEDEDEEEFMNQMYHALLLKHQKEREALEQRQMEELRRFESVREKKRKDFGMSLQQIDKSNSSQRYTAAAPTPLALPHTTISTPSLSGLSFSQSMAPFQHQTAPNPPQHQAQHPQHPQQHPQQQSVQHQQPGQHQPTHQISLPPQAYNTLPLSQPQQVYQQAYQPQISQQPQQLQQQYQNQQFQQMPQTQIPSQPQQSQQPHVTFQHPHHTQPQQQTQQQHAQMQAQHQAQVQAQQQALQAHQAQMQMQQMQQQINSNAQTQSKERKDKDLASKLTAITMKSLEAFSNSGNKLGDVAPQHPPQHAQSQPQSLGYLQTQQTHQPSSMTQAYQANAAGYILPSGHGSKTPTPPTSGTLANTPIPFASPSGYTSPNGTVPIPIPTSVTSAVNSFMTSCLSPPSAPSSLAPYSAGGGITNLLTPASPPNVFSTASGFVMPHATHNINKSGSRTPPASLGLPTHAQLMDALFANVVIPEKPSSNPIPVAVAGSNTGASLHHPPASMGAAPSSQFSTNAPVAGGLAGAPAIESVLGFDVSKSM